jgi:glycerol uptake facilitator-like aquaporin
VIVAEVILTGVFLLVILGSTDDRAPKGFAGLSIGLTLTLIHLISIPISNTSVNPARSTGVAFFNGDGAPAQLGCSGWRRYSAPPSRASPTRTCSAAMRNSPTATT